MTCVMSIGELQKTVRDWKGKPEYVYVGCSAQYGPVKWGNPYSIGANGSKADVMELYEGYLLEQMGQDNSLVEEVRNLHGKTLVYSTNDGSGSILAKWAERLTNDWHHIEKMWSSITDSKGWRQEFEAIVRANAEEEAYCNLLFTFARNQCSMIKDESSFWKWRHEYLDPAFSRAKYGPKGKYGIAREAA